MSPGALVSFMLYQQSLSSAFSMMGDVFSALTAAVGAADKVRSWGLHVVHVCLNVSAQLAPTTQARCCYCKASAVLEIASFTGSSCGHQKSFKCAAATFLPVAVCCAGH